MLEYSSTYSFFSNIYAYISDNIKLRFTCFEFKMKTWLTLQRPPADESSELLYSSLWTTYDGLKQLQNSLYFSFYM